MCTCGVRDRVFWHSSLYLCMMLSFDLLRYCNLLSEHHLVAPKHTRTPDCYCYGSECDTWDPFKVPLPSSSPFKYLFNAFSFSLFPLFFSFLFLQITLVVLLSLFIATLGVVSIVKYMKYRRDNNASKFKELHT